MSAQELERLITSFRDAGLRGKGAKFSAVIQKARKAAQALGDQEDVDTPTWRSLLRFYLETADVGALLHTLTRPVPETADVIFTRATVLDFVTRYRAALDDTHALVCSYIAGRKSAVAADLCIGTWFRLLLLPAEYNSSRDIWLQTVNAAAKEVESRGLSLLLLPDYMIPFTDRTHRFLSFHTHGVEPKTVHFKPSDFPRRVILDRGGYSGWSTLASAKFENLVVPDFDAVDRFYEEHREQVLHSNISKYNQKEVSEGVSLPEKYVFVALQVAADRTQSLARMPMLEMLDTVVRRFKGTDIAVVVKRHPKCQEPTVAARLATLQAAGIIILTDDSIHQLIPNCLGVCTVNSGVGSEAIVYLKPIYLFGEADYNWVAHRISNFADFEEATSEFEPRRSVSDMKRFLYYYRNVYQTDIDEALMLQSRVGEAVFAAEEWRQDPLLVPSGRDIFSRSREVLLRVLGFSKR